MRKPLLPCADLVDVDEVVQRSDLLLPAVPDDALEALVLALDFKPGQFVVHCSGATASRSRPGTSARRAAARVAPAMTLTGTSLDADRLSSARSPSPRRNRCAWPPRRWSWRWGGEPIWIPEEARPVYHAALAHSANHLSRWSHRGWKCSLRAGVDIAGRLLTPLLQASLDNAMAWFTIALTGPVVAAMRAPWPHMWCARRRPQLRAAYIAMARLTADRALADGLLKPVAAEGPEQLWADPRGGDVPRRAG